jgi:membrane protein DedA with SNARE-associated domain
MAEPVVPPANRRDVGHIGRVHLAFIRFALPSVWTAVAHRGPGRGRPVIEHLLSMPAWLALLVVFALPALEASAFVGFLFPGETAVVLGGVVASRGHVPLAAVLAAAVVGAVAGDAVGYVVGRRWGRRILARTAGRIVRPEHLDRAEGALAERGGWTVLVGRFTVALRVLVPGLAGMGGMPYRTFAVFNVTGGLLWATAMATAGYLAGNSWHAVAHRLSTAGLALTAVLVVGFVGVRWWRRRRSPGQRAGSPSYVDRTARAEGADR